MIRKMSMLAAVLLSAHAMTAHAAGAAPAAAPATVVPAMDCTLILPPNPLTATGLATPFQLTNTNPGEVCHELDPNQSAFVQAAIIDPQSGHISIYAPLVIDAGTQPAVAPTPPVLPPNAIVALWFGFNANNLKLQGPASPKAAKGPDHPHASYDDNEGMEHEHHGRGAGGDPSAGDDDFLADNRCVNGIGASLFSQFSYCNAPAFFAAADAAVAAGKLTIPPLGMGKDGQPCPTTRSFGVVDQDQSDNVPTQYLSYKGQVAQYNMANVANLSGAKKFGNPSDNRLVDLLLDPALGCTPFTAPDLSNPGFDAPALPLNELQARAYQAAPVALVPMNDPMVLVDTQQNLQKVNAYRRGVHQPHARSASDADSVAYCTNLRKIHPAKLKLDQTIFTGRPSPFPLMATNLFTWMSQRYVQSYANLGCDVLLKQPVNVTLTTDANGVVTDALITP